MKRTLARHREGPFFLMVVPPSKSVEANDPGPRDPRVILEEMEETMRKGTLIGILKGLGWTYKNHDKPMPPINKDIPEYLFSHQEVSVPVPVY